jgi:hypothetical protein
MPGGQLAPASAAKDKDVDLFRLRHKHPPCSEGAADPRRQLSAGDMTIF